jgi:prepilin-type N-terminal cleavage/methylation domain-containing protein
VKKQKGKDPSWSGESGFSLIEVLIAIALMGIALLGMAQMFTFSILNNSRADKLSSASFLAQQQIDSLRNLTSDELIALSSPMDQQLDINSDSVVDFRRITVLQNSGTIWNIRILVFQGMVSGVNADSLIQNPVQYRVKADIGTVISR